MDAKPNTTVPARPINRHLSATERRAAQAASLANQQATLKQEAAERRARRANQNAPAMPTPPRIVSQGRSGSR